MMSVCRPHPEKNAPWSIYTDVVYGWDYPDNDTDDKNSPNVIHPVRILSRYGYPDTYIDRDTWNSGLRLTTAYADKQLLTNITFLDSFEFRVPSTEHCFELQMNI